MLLVAELWGVAIYEITVCPLPSAGWVCLGWPVALPTPPLRHFSVFKALVLNLGRQAMPCYSNPAAVLFSTSGSWVGPAAYLQCNMPRY